MNLVWFQKVVGQVTETEVTEFSVLMRLLYNHCEIFEFNRLYDCVICVINCPRLGLNWLRNNLKLTIWTTFSSEKQQCSEKFILLTLCAFFKFYFTLQNASPEHPQKLASV